MSKPAHTIRIRVDATNPGQFFACCGLLELAARLSSGALGCFEKDSFVISEGPSLDVLIKSIVDAELQQEDPGDDKASPMFISTPFELRLDWWKSRDKRFSPLKVWAGSMSNVRIARAMQNAMRESAFATAEMLNVAMIVFEPSNPENKVEPFYFDARRGLNSHSRDIGFAPNDLTMTTLASPSVEFLSLVGLQRVHPVSSDTSRVFDYHTWSHPTPPVLAPVVVAGIIQDAESCCYRFESWYRTGDRKLKAFRTARPITASHL